MHKRRRLTLSDTGREWIGIELTSRYGGNGAKGRCSIPEPTQPQVLTSDATTDYTKNDTKPDDLQLICEAWPELSEPVKEGMIAMVMAARTK